eukprot:CAMPEP_0113473526 /NCGR_PEP_ID=MMETSP0014_2-20120614/18092_1 /TAXON_ID=2857 /ORGANISM="Nitzschia sp." /LENGTH=2243 /DNA_ID=CAMNT_0000366301 /DNA_START=471 /DNA_END=7202 /DNA_ORIENTATION=+ /assembly_acc=CAM_ASM_000159
MIENNGGESSTTASTTMNFSTILSPPSLDQGATPPPSILPSPTGTRRRRQQRRTHSITSMSRFVVFTTAVFMGAIMAVTLTTTTVVDAIPILGGRYQTVTDVQDYLNLALDAAAMKEALEIESKQDIYKNGSSPLGSDVAAAATVTLQSLSLTADNYMAENPYYHIFRHAFLVLGDANEGETTGLFDGAPIEVYGDTIVNDLFDLSAPNIETEAAVVMNVWMACVNYVWDVLTECRAQDKETAMLALDKAVALWVGEGQVEGSNDEGHLLYHIAQNAGERFGQDVGEAEVNTKVVGLFVEMQTMLLGDQCSDVDGYETMRQNVKRLIGVMTVPLVQNLVHHTMNVDSEGGGDFVELYALSVIPRVAACDPEAYDTELHLDVLRSLPVSKQQESIDAIQRAYSCLDITCADVGTYLGGQLPECTDPMGITRGGYTAGQVTRSKSYIDRDIRQIDIFLKFQAYGIALDWYTHGWNSNFSLRNLAKNEVVPALQSSESQYTTYSQYYQDDVFAHTLIQNIIELVPPYNEASSEQVRNSAIGFFKYVLMKVTAVDHLRYGIEECRIGNRDSSIEYIDAAAMLFVGSMEGSADGGHSFGGELLFTTAKKLCADFGTCVGKDGGATSAAANDAIISSLFDVKSDVDLQNCDNAAVTVESEILPAMSVPLVQGTLKYASVNEGLVVGSTDASLSIGDAFVRGILPLVAQISPENAQTLRSQMQFQLDASPVSGGFSAVADVFRASIAGMGIKCDLIGVLVDKPETPSLCADGPPTESGPAPGPVPGGQTGLAFGRYTFDDANAADSDASFALDVKAMFQAESNSEASTIYADGSNVLNGLSGESTISSLGAMSTRASQSMSDDLMFNIFKYALYDDVDLENTAAEFFYADDVVMEGLQDGSDKKLAAEATVILNIWMMIVHRLYAAVRSCDIGDAPTALIDSSVALWLGKEQAEGKFDNGWMLYGIGQSSMKFYGFAEGEAPVNTKLMSLFNEAQSIARNCPQTTDSSTLLRAMVHDITRNLTKPLIMSLLFHMVKNSKNMVELYAVAVVPQCAACNTQAHSALQDALFSGYNKETSLTDDLYDNLAIFLRCQRITCEDIRTEVDADDLLKDLVENLCERLDYDLESFLPMAGYTPQTPVIEPLRLDLDALEMYIMMRTQAYRTAMDIYENGHNSVGSSAFFGTEVGSTNQLTLKQLATTFEREKVSQYQYYKNYFDSGNYADHIMTQAIRRTGDYASASREAASVIVRRTAQTMISFMGSLLKLQSAIDKCKSGAADDARSDWDRAVALYIGFSQGIRPGADRQGGFMYALGNEVCNDFGACETSGEATVNQQLVFQFAGGRDSLIDGECDHIEKTVSAEIIPRMTIPLVQATISFNLANNGVDVEDLASLHVVSQAAAPLVQRVSSSDADILRQSYGNYQTLSTDTPISSIVSAFTSTIQSTGISCDEVGSPVGFILCTGGPVGDTPTTSLGQELYDTTTYVQGHADIAKDINDISQALLENNLELAKTVYRTGKNSQIYDKEGKFLRLRTLKEFSTESTNDMLEEAEFNIFMYALNNDRLYADNLVEQAFQNVVSTDRAIPAEAAIVLNLWMQIVHQLHETLQACNLNRLRNDDGVHGMDIAAAYWIGDGQVNGDADNGHLLYALAEKFGELFDIDDGGQSRTNTNILRLFNEAKNEISVPNACSDNRTTYTRLRRIANQLVSQMTIPLAQGLIHYLRANDRNRVKIYATAFVPLVAGCSPSLFEYLQDKLINMNYKVVEVEEIVQKLRESFPCLGLECDDIGVHVSYETDESARCDDPDVYEPLAGYRPASDVREAAKLDLDIREIEILMEMKAYGAALDLYTYGKHVNGGSQSLSEIALTQDRTIVPEYQSFVHYYENDGFADSFIRSVMDTHLTSFSDDQRRMIVVKACQVLVVYFGALQNAYEAEAECSSSSQLRTIGDTETWDQVAAQLIGHLEGPNPDGTTEGYMFYELAQGHCLEFGTCEKDGSAVEMNDQLINLLYTGRGAVIDNNCEAIRKAADDLSSLLLVPIIQGALSSSIGLSKGENEQLRAEGYVYSRALIPLVNKRRAAGALEEYLGATRPKHSRKTAAEVHDALAKAYPDMGVDCTLIGEAGGKNPCDGVVYGTPTYVWIIVGVFGGLLVCCCVGYVYRRRRRVTSSLPENNPKFVTSEGELNHSMDLLEKAFASTVCGSPGTDRDATGRSISPDSEREALNAFHDASPIDDEDFESVPSLSARLTDDADII